MTELTALEKVEQIIKMPNGPGRKAAMEQHVFAPTPEGELLRAYLLEVAELRSEGVHPPETFEEPAYVKVDRCTCNAAFCGPGGGHESDCGYLEVS